jgi:ketosteroid isomerase-like protein
MTATTADRSTANLTTVKEIYDAFGRGDIPAILGKIAPGCRWESWENNRAQREGVPTLQPRTGPEGVAQFFAAVGDLDISDFRVLDILPGDRQVAVEVMIEYTTPAGGRLRDEEVHLWALDDSQRVTRLRHYVDTAKHIAAYAGEDTTA